LNPLLPPEAINLAIEAVTRDRSTMSLVRASQEVHHLLKNGVKATFQINGIEKTENVKLIPTFRTSHKIIQEIAYD
jgi:type I restriction enzyme R subunit